MAGVFAVFGFMVLIALLVQIFRIFYGKHLKVLTIRKSQEEEEYDKKERKLGDDDDRRSIDSDQTEVEKKENDRDRSLLPIVERKDTIPEANNNITTTFPVETGGTMINDGINEIYPLVAEPVEVSIPKKKKKVKKVKRKIEAKTIKSNNNQQPNDWNFWDPFSWTQSPDNNTKKEPPPSIYKTSFFNDLSKNEKKDDDDFV